METENGNKRWFFLWALSAILAVFFVFAKEMFASESPIVINEILYNALGSDNKSNQSSYEKVVLKNISGGSVDISNWEIRLGSYFSLSKITTPVPSDGSVVIYLGQGVNANLDFQEDDVAYSYVNKSGSQLGDSHGNVALYKSHSHTRDTIVDFVAYGEKPDSTNYNHALAVNLWKVDDFILNVDEGCSIKLKEKINQSSLDWESNCENNDETVEEKISEPEQSEGEKNELNIQMEIKQDKKIFPKIYAEFEAVILDKEGRKLQLSRKGKKYEYECNDSDKYKCPASVLKFTWSFGDKHSSYLFSTKHKYEKIGTYSAKLTVYDPKSKKKTIKNFTVVVGKIEHPEVKIISVNANPVGSDTNNETITVQNKSGKKINLKGWSIATGWKKLINHPIIEDFEIKAGKIKEITREFSKFTLNNSKNKIELRYPDGKVAYELKYEKKDKGIAEGEIYQKVKGGWNWVQQKLITKKPASPAGGQETNKLQNTIINDQEVMDIKQSAAENESPVENNEQENTNININNDIENIPNEDIVMDPKIERTNKLALNDKNIFKINLADSAPRVLGAETVRESDGIYFFTPEITKQEHYASTFFRNILVIINAKMNLMINFFLEIKILK